MSDPFANTKLFRTTKSAKISPPVPKKDEKPKVEPKLSKIASSIPIDSEAADVKSEKKPRVSKPKDDIRTMVESIVKEMLDTKVEDTALFSRIYAVLKDVCQLKRFARGFRPGNNELHDVYELIKKRIGLKII